MNTKKTGPIRHEHGKKLPRPAQTADASEDQDDPILKFAGSFTGLYGPSYLQDLRREWPDRPRA